MNENPFKKAGLVAGIFFLSAAHCRDALATSFGPITIYTQAQNTQYYVHGRINGASWVQSAPHIERPYTYYHVQISEQMSGEALPTDLVIRQPGGELGGLGYNMAGVATFTPGEDVFLALHDTDEPQPVKEVVGLASGKFRVEAKDGKQVVISGLGIAVVSPEGGPLSPVEFSSLLRRISKGEATEADKKIYVSQRPMHEEGEDPIKEAALEEQARAILHPDQRRPAEASHPPSNVTVSEQTQVSPNPLVSQANSVQESPPKADETSTGFSSWGWIAALTVLVVLVVALYLAVIR